MKCILSCVWVIFACFYGDHYALIFTCNSTHAPSLSQYTPSISLGKPERGSTDPYSSLFPSLSFLILKKKSRQFEGKTRRVHTKILWCKQQGLHVQTICELAEEKPDILETLTKPTCTGVARFMFPGHYITHGVNHRYDAGSGSGTSPPRFLLKAGKDHDSIFSPLYFPL